MIDKINIGPQRCPFCGSGTLNEVVISETLSSVQCERCKASGPVSEIAWESWNNRILLTVKDLMRRWSCSDQQIRLLVDTGKLGFVNIGSGDERRLMRFAFGQVTVFEQYSYNMPTSQNA